VKDPDFDALRAAAAEAEALVRAGQLTPATFDPVMAKAKAAVGGHTRFLECMLEYTVMARESGDRADG
jgi:hypothetical protein